MQSKKSCFNGPVFRKNLTRFAPAWLLYTLCLILGMILLYTSDVGRDTKNFWFASRMGQAIQYLGLANLFWAPLCAMMLFGDLFTSRMCNALHAMPIRRESWFVTNCVSGLAFSIVPTAVMTLASLPLLVQTCVVDAWQIAFWFFLGANLSFVCFFGIAVFSVFCAGNRLAMGLIYALINGGAFLVYWLVDTLYTPMLYGVVTPSRLAELLTPISHLTNNTFVEVENYLNLRELFDGRLDEMTAKFWLTDAWGPLCIYAASGVLFALIGLALYKKRDLECAGDMVAFKAFEPIFVVLFAAFAATGGQFMVYMFLGSRGLNPMFLAAGMVVGWFAGKMLIARSTRVFRPKNWLGLIVLSLVIAASLAAAHFDIFGIETWMPEVENVTSVTLSRHAGGYNASELTDPQEIRDVLRLQELALEGREEDSGSFTVDETVTYVDGVGFCYPDGTPYDGEWYYVSTLYITYTLDNGKVVERYYKIRTTDEVRTLCNEYMSRWETVSQSAYYSSEERYLDLSEIRYLNVFGQEVPDEYLTVEDVEALMAAIRADCEERTMTQSSYFHDGHFHRENNEGEGTYTRDMYISLGAADNTGFGINFYPDSRHVIAWCVERNLLNGWEISDQNIYPG